MNKNNINDLAIFGGKPVFANKLYVGRPNVGDKESLLARFQDLLNRKWLTNNGPYVQELERKIAEYVGVKNCIAICNATAALELVIRATSLKGQVIIPSFTFIALPHALQWLGITPVFCDVNPETHNIDPHCIERMITPLTTGLIGVHLWGRSCDVGLLTYIAKRHSLRLLFDSAHAFACSYEGKMIGGFGDAEVFSFHATKFFNTFEGGAVVTDNDELAAKIRLMKNFGFAGYDNVIHLGINAKMSEISAAMGLTSLESIDEFIFHNKKNHNLYRKALRNIPGITLVSYDEAERCNYQYVVLEIDEWIAGIDRDQLMEILWAENIIARRYFFPGCHRMEPYKSLYPQSGAMLPVTEKLTERVLLLPTGTSIGQEDIIKISNIIALAIENSVSVRTKLKENIMM